MSFFRIVNCRAVKQRVFSVSSVLSAVLRVTAVAVTEPESSLEVRVSGRAPCQKALALAFSNETDPTAVLGGHFLTEGDQIEMRDRRLRRAILVVLIFGLMGTGTELLLMGHTEDAWQVIPLLLIGLSLATLVWHLIAPARASLHLMRGIMFLCLVSGALGSLLHYQGNTEFELEMSPGLSGFALFKEAISGASPALAPGTMILLGLLGLIYTLGHPALSADHTSTTGTSE